MVDDGRVIHVPNFKVFSDSIVNYSRGYSLFMCTCAPKNRRNTTQEIWETILKQFQAEQDITMI